MPTTRAPTTAFGTIETSIRSMEENVTPSPRSPASSLRPQSRKRCRPAWSLSALMSWSTSLAESISAWFSIAMPPSAAMKLEPLATWVELWFSVPSQVLSSSLEVSIWSLKAL